MYDKIHYKFKKKKKIKKKAINEYLFKFSFQYFHR